MLDTDHQSTPCKSCLELKEPSESETVYLFSFRDSGSALERIRVREVQSVELKHGLAGATCWKTTEGIVSTGYDDATPSRDQANL